jgi:hypothetical protein
LVKSRGCSGFKENGQLCGAPKLRSIEFCLMHDPEHVADVAEARGLGGFQRGREVAVVGAYDLGGVETLASAQPPAAEGVESYPGSAAQSTLR